MDNRSYFISSQLAAKSPPVCSSRALQLRGEIVEDSYQPPVSQSHDLDSLVLNSSELCSESVKFRRAGGQRKTKNLALSLGKSSMGFTFRKSDNCKSVFIGKVSSLTALRASKL